MNEKFLFSYYVRYSIICALAYCIPVIFFFKQDDYTALWILYIGNGVYAALLLVSGYFVNKKLDDYASLRSMINAGFKVIFSSIILAVILTAIIALVFQKYYFSGRPANGQGLIYILALSTVLVNFLIGSFCVCVGAFTLKRNQKTEKGNEIT